MLDETILRWISEHGYIGIYTLLMLGIVGLPVPDETLLVFSGYLVHAGRLRPIPALASAFLGSASGISLSYFIGRTVGLGLIHKYGRFLHITQARVKQVHDWFERMGRWSLLIGYYVPGVRHFTAVVAGTSKLDFPVFACFAYSGALIWVSTFLILGYYLGETWARTSEQIHRKMLIGTGIAIAAGLIYYFARRRRKFG